MRPKVPTNVITGFLGAGKTSAILHLLKAKPAEENWAVLVNEFGEIGIDGSLVGGERQDQCGIYVREVPGGCMCCMAGLPMRKALAQLLQRSRPDRLLIEPTGLGHPKEVLGVLSEGSFQDHLDINSIITLVDARRLADERYANHETFQQQIAIADVVVGNKADLYGQCDQEALERYVSRIARPGVNIVITEGGILDFSLLADSTGSASVTNGGHDHHHHKQPVAAEQPIPEQGYLRAENSGEGFQSVGWRFTSAWVFDRRKLELLFGGFEVERLKGVFITEGGNFGYNLTPDALTETSLDACSESRVEIIGSELDDAWEEQLLACVATGRELAE